MSHDTRRHRALHTAGIVAAVVVIGVVLWIDIATGIWQDLVILAGLAAGLVTFLLTVLVVDKVVARSTARRWAPVTRLALTELLHDLADEERSEIARGHVVPRTLPLLSLERPPEEWPIEHRDLRNTVVTERRILSQALSRWVSFLAGSSDTAGVLRHVADITLQLDVIRDASLRCDHAPGATTRASLNTEILSCNAQFAALSREILAALAAQGDPVTERHPPAPTPRS